MLVTRRDLEDLEQLLCASDAARRHSESLLKQTSLELSEQRETASLDHSALRVSRDVLQNEVTSLRSRLSEALDERDELIRSIEPLEFEISLLRKEAESSDAARSQRAAVFRTYFGLDDAASYPAGLTTSTAAKHVDVSGIGGGSPVRGENHPPPPHQSAREQQLLEVVEQSASVFLTLDQEIRESQAELQRLRAEKQNWLNSEYELHAAVVRLEHEREQYIARELERSSSFVVSVHNLLAEEWRERRLLDAQADAVLHGFAYQRCRNDAAIISKQLGSRLATLEFDRNRETRLHESVLKFEIDRAKALIQAQHEKEMREVDAKLETLRLARQKVELQNSMLKTNCDEWREHSEKKDRDSDDHIRRVVAEAEAQLIGRDQLLRVRDGQIEKLKDETSVLKLELSRARDDVTNLAKQLEAKREASRRKVELERCSYVQTEPVENAADMKKRLLREIEEEDEVQFARRVTSHHVFIKLQDFATNTHAVLEERDQQLQRTRADLQTAQVMLEETQRKLAMEQRQHVESHEVLRCESEAANRRSDLVQRQREIAEREVNQLQSTIVSVQQDHAKAMRDLHHANIAKAAAEAKMQSATESLETLTAQLGDEMHEAANKLHAIQEKSALVTQLQSEQAGLQRQLLERDETIARASLGSAIDVIMLRLGAIGESLFRSD